MTTDPDAFAIFAMHGFDSSIEQSSTVQGLMAAFPDQTVAITRRDRDPELERGRLVAALATCPPARTLLVGTSLGGFWALHLAQAMGLPAVALNPATDPAGSLAKFPDETADVDLEGFRPFYLRDGGFPQPVVVVLGAQDALLPPQPAAALLGPIADVRMVDAGHSIPTPVTVATVRSVLETLGWV